MLDLPLLSLSFPSAALRSLYHSHDSHPPFTPPLLLLLHRAQAAPQAAALFSNASDRLSARPHILGRACSSHRGRRCLDADIDQRVLSLLLDLDIDVCMGGGILLGVYRHHG